MEVNYFASVALTKAVLPYMKRQKSGHIVVISSIVRGKMDSLFKGLQCLFIMSQEIEGVSLAKVGIGEVRIKA